MVLGVHRVAFRRVLWSRGLRVVQMGVESKCVLRLGLDEASRQSRRQPVGSGTTSRNSGRALTSGGCSGDVAVLLFDRVPLLAPVVSLQGAQFEKFAIVHDLVLRVKATLLEDVVVCLEHGQECGSRSWRTLDDGFNEVDFLGRQACQFWDRCGGRARIIEQLLCDGESRLFGELGGRRGARGPKAGHVVIMLRRCGRTLSAGCRGRRGGAWGRQAKPARRTQTT